MPRTAERRTAIPLPEGISQDRFMIAMTAGHGYHWTILSKAPLFVAHGGTESPGLTEMLLVGRQVVFGADGVFEERLGRLLEAMQRACNTGGA